MKRCKQCGQDKPLGEFLAHGKTKDGLRSRCKDCMSGRTQSPATDEGGVPATLGTESPAARNNHSATSHIYRLLVKRQGGVCAVCRQPETARDENGELLPLTLYGANHDGRIIKGVVCKLCNMGLSMFRDSPVLLARAIEFITRRSTGLNAELRTLQD